MGLGSRRGGGQNYLGIYGGAIVKEWRKSKPSEDQIPEGKELQERTLSMGPNSGNTVWFVEFDFLSGVVKKIVLDDSGDWGDSIELHVDDVGEGYVLQFKADSSQGRDFLTKLENIDFSGDVSFEPWQMTKQEWFDLTGKSINGTSKSGMTIKNGGPDGEKVLSFYTKDDNKGLPEWVKKEGRKGKVEWDSTDQTNFLLDRLEEVIKETFGGTGAAQANPSTTPEAKEAPVKKEKVKTDLPFG